MPHRERKTRIHLPSPNYSFFNMAVYKKKKIVLWQKFFLMSKLIKNCNMPYISSPQCKK